MRARPAALVPLGVLGLLVGISPAASASAASPGWSVVARLTDDRITEASGLAASARHPGVLYVVNDSGDAPRVFAVGASGRTRAVLTLDGASATDWESLSSGPDGTLWVGDLGDNARVRDQVTVYRVPEPRALRDGPVRWAAFRLRYPDRAQDAEALMVNPRTGRLFVATKSLAGAGLYVAPSRLDPDALTTLRRVGSVGPLVTGGEFSPDGARLVLRDYGAASLYDVADDGRLTNRRTVRLPDQVQGESVTWTRDGQALLVGSEGAGSDIWRVPLPSAAQATPSVNPSASRVRSEPAVQDGPRWPGNAAVPGVLAAAGALAVLAVLVRHRRH